MWMIHFKPFFQFWEDTPKNLKKNNNYFTMKKNTMISFYNSNEKVWNVCTLISCFPFFLFRPPSYLHKLQLSEWNHEEMGKFTWKYIELFYSMKNDNSYHALKFVQIKCNLIMIFNLVNKIEPIWYEFGSKTLNAEKWTLSKIRELSKKCHN